MNPTTMADWITRRGGIVRSRQLLAAGATRGDLRRAVAAATVTRVRDGVYTVPDVDPRVRVAAEHGGEVACASALRRLGVWVLDDALDPHVWLGRHGRRFSHPGCRCVSHHDDGAAAFGYVGIVQALVQVASCLGDEAFFAAFESAWHLGLLSDFERAEVRAGLPAGTRWLVDIARPDAESGLESLLRLRFHRLGIVLTPQVWIPGVGRVDFVVDGVLILEADGRDGHARERDRHKDLMRDAAAAALGYDRLRFDYAMIVYNWPIVEAAVLARLEALGRSIGRIGGGPRTP